MGKPDICVTVPTVRNPECIEDYVANARSHGFSTERLYFLLVTEDFCDLEEMEQMLERLDVQGRAMGQKEREQWFRERGLEEFIDLIPENSHAETSFGLLFLLERDFRYGFFIDDDTEPHDNFNFFQYHLDNLQNPGKVKEVDSSSSWVNVLFQNYERHGLYPRGYPYSCMGEKKETSEVEISRAVASQGLWTNIPDLDAVRILMDGDLRGQAQTRTSKKDFGENFVAANDNYLTVCSMNLAFRREIIPAFYQFPMDDNRWDIGRFDDIWSGVTLKKAADMVGDEVINGSPLCIHNKAERSTFSDLNNEVSGLELNEHFYKAIDRAPEDAESYLEAYREIIEAVERHDFSDYQNSEFMDHCVEKMKAWLEICRRIS